ncbi:MAG: CBS domain-containing protein [Deltaproteobacteria bacterium]|nr:CBS domain-containing protein [Deltaproteobacteria bacterium]
MFVEKWMTPDPVTVRPDDTISSVALEMNQRKLRHFPVCEPTRSGARMVGIVAKYDIARGFPNDLNPFSVEVSEESVPKPVSSVMTKKVITVTPDCPIEEAARLLRSNRIGSLPVLRDTQMIGIITEPDLFEAFISMTAAKSGGTRIFIEPDFNDSPVPVVLNFCRKNRVDILSMMAFHENRLRCRDMTIFRFDGRLPSGFVAEMAALGYRVVSVGS